MSVYGGTEYALQATFKKEGVRKSLPECKKLVQAVLKTYPGIPKYQVEAVILARETGYAETIFGFKRLLPSINGNVDFQRRQDERRAQNTPIQGSAADIMKRSQNTVYEKIGIDTAYFNIMESGAAVVDWTVFIYNEFMDEVKKALRVKPFMRHGHTDMISQIHDEIIAEVDDDPTLVKQYALWQKSVMEIEPIEGFPLPLEAEASVAYSWGEKISLEKYLEQKGES